jgi:phosphatidylinositol alpha-1,6-mannosyltransferase
MQIKFLFITRNYPPKVGGLEAYSYNLIKEFEINNNTNKIVLTKSIVHLFWFIPYCFLKAIYFRWRYKINYIHLCDAMLSPVGILLKIFTAAKISTSVAGLDITYNNFLYQLIIPWCVRRLDTVICISQATRDECIRRGIPHHICSVIPIGVRSEEIYLESSTDELRCRLQKKIGKSMQDKQVLVTVGRLVRRKGVAWFVENVVPHLDGSYLYLIVGNGPESDRIQGLVKNNDLEGRVFMLGELSDEERNLVFNASDIFIMPNISIPGDIEGFGIVALEAGSCGLPVIASNIQGIRDAVVSGKTGILVGEQNPNDYLNAIKTMSLKRADIRSVVSDKFSWNQVYQQYRDTIINP